MAYDFVCVCVCVCVCVRHFRAVEVVLFSLCDDSSIVAIN